MYENCTLFDTGDGDMHNADDFLNQFLKKRSPLYHITRLRNLPGLRKQNTLFSINYVKDHFNETVPTQRFNLKQSEIHIKIGGDFSYTPNFQIKVKGADANFYNRLDSFVFLWNNGSYYKRMLERCVKEYTVAVLEIDPKKFIEKTDHAKIYVSRVNSGSNPRTRVKNKTPNIFIPINQICSNNPLSPKNIQDIKEILIEDKLENLESLVNTVYLYQENRTDIFEETPFKNA